MQMYSLDIVENIGKMENVQNVRKSEKVRQ